MLSKLLFDVTVTTEALFLELVIAGAIVIVAGSCFAKLADKLADQLGIGSGWIGLILLATVTSLPELVTGATATWLGNVDLALGNIFGSCSFNITIIVLLNALLGGGSVLKNVSSSHALTSSFGLALIGLALLGILIVEKFAAYPAFASGTELVWVVVILVAYLGCMRLTYRHERRLNQASIGQNESSTTSGYLRTKIAGIAIVLIAASWWLARLGNVLSTHEIAMLGRPLGATFVGAGFLALATSLPEIVTSITAVRLGKLDLALGNIFGSNMFNIAVIPALKAVSLAKGDALLLTSSHGSAQTMVTGLLAILLTSIAVGAMAYRSERKLLRRFGFDSILIAVTYLGGMILLLSQAP